jgi:hypothetical protein
MMKEGGAPGKVKAALRKKRSRERNAPVEQYHHSSFRSMGAFYRQCEGRPISLA